jgi:hypothetical protein
MAEYGPTRLLGIPKYCSWASCAIAAVDVAAIAMKVAAAAIAGTTRRSILSVNISYSPLAAFIERTEFLRMTSLSA